ncbi:UNKNOWN [Stylonychia lemnae]|uniref:Uncharacterized protein n=1 Tax=Stylonychia lemnae TaxID=5949 RepID=A0A078A2L5_STYLE|nr:UNKNOWN [Stylonychia lemnae]|eukprot:CDW76456.1 UNKNOWN [Stylonychia lemnae]
MQFSKQHSAFGVEKPTINTNLSGKKTSVMDRLDELLNESEEDSPQIISLQKFNSFRIIQPINSSGIEDENNEILLESENKARNDQDYICFQEESKKTENDGDMSSSLSNYFMSPKVLFPGGNDCFTNKHNSITELKLTIFRSEADNKISTINHERQILKKKFDSMPVQRFDFEEAESRILAFLEKEGIHREDVQSSGTLSSLSKNSKRLSQLKFKPLSNNSMLQRRKVYSSCQVEQESQYK